MIRGTEEREVTVEAQIDTGFDGSLALPEALDGGDIEVTLIEN